MVAAKNELWIQAPEVVRLFPTFVWRCRLRPDVHRPINVAILNLELMRVSISFNVMFAAFSQTMGQPLWGDQ